MKSVDLKKLRALRGLNQSRFWTPLGVTQSGGSRYEAGRAMPKPVAMLVQLAHVERIDLASLRGDDVRVGAFLRTHDAALYEKFKAMASSHANGPAQDR